MLFLILPVQKKNHVSQFMAAAGFPFFKSCLTRHSAAAAPVLVNDVRLLVLTWMQQEALDGHVQEPFEPLVLLLGAQDFGLVLQHRVFDGAEDLFGGRRQPVVQEHVQQLQFGHVCLSLTVSSGGTSFCLHPLPRKYITGVRVCVQGQGVSDGQETAFDIFFNCLFV